MPVRSKAQARFLFSQKPKIAKKWEAEGAMGLKGLPEKVAPSADKVKVKIPAKGGY